MRFLLDFWALWAYIYVHVWMALHCNVSGVHVEPGILLFLLLPRTNGLPSDTTVKGHSWHHSLLVDRAKLESDHLKKNGDRIKFTLPNLMCKLSCSKSVRCNHWFLLPDFLQLTHNQRGLKCTKCSEWDHAPCAGVDSTEYVNPNYIEYWILKIEYMLTGNIQNVYFLSFQ